jgi:hypothetical protein
MGGFVWAHDYGTINIYDGWVATGEDIVAANDSLVNIYGGRFGASIAVGDSAVVNLYGGRFDKAGDGASLVYSVDGVINVFGTEFSYGPLLQGGGRNLTGVLSDGSLLDVELYPYPQTLGTGRVVLHTVPEPNAATLLATAVSSIVVFRCRGRRSKRNRRTSQS